MTDKNRQLHEAMGKETFVCCGQPYIHWEEGNEASMGYPINGGEECCGRPEPLPIPDYFTDLNAVREVELFVIEKVGHAKYWDALYKPYSYHDINHGNVKTAIAPAKERAQACLAALGLQEKNES